MVQESDRANHTSIARSLQSGLSLGAAGFGVKSDVIPQNDGLMATVSNQLPRAVFGNVTWQYVEDVHLKVQNNKLSTVSYKTFSGA